MDGFAAERNEAARNDILREGRGGKRRSGETSRPEDELGSRRRRVRADARARRGGSTGSRRSLPVCQASVFERWSSGSVNRRRRKELGPDVCHGDLSLRPSVSTFRSDSGLPLVAEDSSGTAVPARFDFIGPRMSILKQGEVERGEEARLEYRLGEGEGRLGSASRWTRPSWAQSNDQDAQVVRLRRPL